ncbi:MAG: NAD-dependent epimerase/dehydratase family protein, partial [Halobacteriaceae archaeon]
VRPCIVYGPYDYTERFDYWIDRVRTYDRIIVPGDGLNIWHTVFVEDVAKALRVVAENGHPGEAYNVGDRKLVTLEEMLSKIAVAADTTIDVIGVSERELSIGDLSADDFVLYRKYPHILDTAKLSQIGWDSTEKSTAIQKTVDEHIESQRDGNEYDFGRDAEERILNVLETI